MMDELFQLSQQFIAIYNRPYLRYFLQQHTLENRFSIITGARGVGKTTTIIQYLLRFAQNDPLSAETLYVQADHFLVGKYSLYEIAESFVKEGGRLICFDEVHKYPQWSQELKSINDTFPGLKIIASGSSAMEIHKGSHDLSRRAIVYRMHGMSFREFIELVMDIKLDAFSIGDILEKHPVLARGIIKKVETDNKKILPLFKQYLEIGCYPYFSQYENKNLFHITLEQNLHATVENDLPAVFPGLSGSGIKKIKKLVSFIAQSVPFTPDLKNIKRLLEIGDERTLKNYLKYLEDGGLILMVSKKGRSLRVMEKPEKIFLSNSNMMYAIASRDNIQRGNLRETFFVNGLTPVSQVTIADSGDFTIDGSFTFEIGGKGKGFKQIKDMENSFLALDDIETGIGNKIPLWLFGFLY